MLELACGNNSINCVKLLCETYQYNPKDEGYEDGWRLYRVAGCQNTLEILQYFHNKFVLKLEDLVRKRRILHERSFLNKTLFFSSRNAVIKFLVNEIKLTKHDLLESSSSKKNILQKFCESYSKSVYDFNNGIYIDYTHEEFEEIIIFLHAKYKLTFDDLKTFHLDGFYRFYPNFAIVNHFDIPQAYDHYNIEIIMTYNNIKCAKLLKIMKRTLKLQEPDQSYLTTNLEYNLLNRINMIIQKDPEKYRINY